MSSLIEERWKELLRQAGPAHLRVDPHPLQLFFGADHLGRPILFLITETKPELPRLSAAVTSERRQREGDGLWTLVLALDERSLLRPFMGFCMEVIRESSGELTEQRALASVYRTIAQWRSLLRLQAGRSATKEQLRGLFAELWLALHGIGVPVREAVDAWTGPYGAAQDFRMKDGRAYEVKAVFPEARSVEIASVEQLDPAHNNEIVLCVVVLEESETPIDEFINVPTIIRLLHDALAAESGNSDSLEHRLGALSFDPRDPQSEDIAFKVLGIRRFHVKDAFPRINRADVPDGVDDVRYRIRLSSISGFEIGTGSLDDTSR